MKKIPVYQPSFIGKEKEYVTECLESTWISSKGKFISEFEEKFAEYTGVQKALSVCNGTVALHLALLALEIKPGDEVIVPTFTYIASVNAIKYVGATPVFVDSEINTWQIDTKDIEKKITSKTKAVIAVHLYGGACKIDEISRICKVHNLFLIEDCAEAIGTFYKEIHVGNYGDISTFSFFGNKTITTGEGGMVITNNPDFAKIVNRLKGQGLAANREYWHDIVGYNYRMTNICAAIGLAQLEFVNQFLSAKKKIAEFYIDRLKNLPLSFQDFYSDSESSFWMFSILTKDEKSKDGLREKLAKNGVETRPVFNPVHMMPMYFIPEISSHFPVADHLGKRGINLPSFPSLSDDDLLYIVNTIFEYFNEN